MQDVNTSANSESPDSHVPENQADGLTPGARKSRREFFKEAVAVGVGLTIASSTTDEALAEPQNPSRITPNNLIPAPEETPITLQINGKAYPMTVEPRVTLLDALRERAGLTGAKKGCDHGQCGACTVHIEGRRMLSCLTLAIMHQGQNITTIEGLAEGENLHPMQSAFVAHDGFQCGFCTPGQIMSAVGMMQEGHAHSEAEIKELMSGNICRCGAYPNIVAAIREVMEGKKDAAV